MAKNAENDAVWWIHGGTWHAYFQTPSGIDRGEQESTHQHFERTRSQKSAEMTDLNGFGNYPQFPLLLSENVRMWYCSPSSLARRIPSVYSCRCKMRSSWPQLVWDNDWICWSDIWKWDVKCKCALHRKLGITNAHEYRSLIWIWMNMDHLTSFILIYIYIVIIDNTIICTYDYSTYYPVDGLDLCNSASQELRVWGLAWPRWKMYTFCSWKKPELPSGKRLHNYGKSPFYSWVNQLFLLPFSITVSLPEGKWRFRSPGNSSHYGVFSIACGWWFCIGNSWDNYRSMKPSKYAGQILPKIPGKSELTWVVIILSLPCRHPQGLILCWGSDFLRSPKKSNLCWPQRCLN